MYVIDTLGRVYKCKSHHPYNLNNIENEIVIGRYLGEVKIPKFTENYAKLKSCEKHAIMDAVEFSLFTFNEDLEAILCFSKVADYYDKVPEDSTDLLLCIEFFDAIRSVIYDR